MRLTFNRYPRVIRVSTNDDSYEWAIAYLPMHGWWHLNISDNSGRSPEHTWSGHIRFGAFELNMVIRPLGKFYRFVTWMPVAARWNNPDSYGLGDGL
jgi:hypothetical protein